jgi:hypothetical protein
VQREFRCASRLCGSHLDSGSSVRLTMKNFGTPLRIASFIGSEPLVERILEKGSDVNAVGGNFEATSSRLWKEGESTS